ncbi:MAG: PAS domain S-box protein [Proteobacteria bacterium]|nr:PAS domain S-box protein [Pseudomonadota bacterium]
MTEKRKKVMLEDVANSAVEADRPPARVNPWERDRTRSRAVTYAVFCVVLVVGFLAVRDSTWQSGPMFHTLLESLATLLALIVGVLALIRFYSKKTNTFLFIGSAFLGTAFLDGYHTIVTSVPVASMLPSTLPSLIPWSWVASRMLLSFLLFASWVAWRREAVHGAKGRISERTVYASVALLTLLSFVFFALAPLPPAYYPNFFFHRPEEFLPALFFLLATIGYLTKGDWRHDPFEHWLVLSLILGFVSQAMFMSFSGQLFDMMFDVAHTLKKVSYALVLVGLTISMFRLFQRAEQSADNLRLANLSLQNEIAGRERVEADLRESELRTSTIIDSVIDAIITISPDGTVESYNKAAMTIFGHVEDEVLGKNVKMLMPEGTATQHDGFLTNYVETGEGGIIGVPREVVGQRKNGTTFPMELAVIDMQLDDGVVFVGMIRDITERKKVERMKNEFVSTVSHELRTPLTSIIGALGLVEGGLAGEISEKTRDLIGIAARNSARLVRLIGDILDIEKIESGEIEIDFQPIDLAQLVDRAIMENTSYAADFDVQISAAEIAEGAIIHGGEDQILQVLTNLISNAAKFAPRHSTIEISTQRLRGAIRTSVTDHGPGIPDEFRSRIFGKFTQADSSDTRRPGGTGLGLSICKALVEKMDGTIGFRSETGSGATFYFDLPEWESSRQGARGAA